MGQDGLYRIDLNLQSLCTDLQLLFPLLPSALLNIKLLLQLLLCTAQPVGAANRQVKHWTLSTSVYNTLNYYNTRTVFPLTILQMKNRINNGERIDVLENILTSLCNNWSSSGDTLLLNWAAKEQVCWQRFNNSKSAASIFRASGVRVRRPSKLRIVEHRKVTCKKTIMKHKRFNTAYLH